MFTAQQLPDDVAATLTAADVRRILDLQVEYFERKGVSGNGSSHTPVGPVVIGAAIVMYLIEFFADKIPYVDTLWDLIHTAIRPIGGALIAVATLGDASTPVEGLIALLGGKRDPDMPNVPTVGETVPGYVAQSWQGLFARAGTPKPSAKSSVPSRRTTACVCSPCSGRRAAARPRSCWRASCDG